MEALLFVSLIQDPYLEPIDKVSVHHVFVGSKRRVLGAAPVRGLSVYPLGRDFSFYSFCLAGQSLDNGRDWLQQ